MTTYSCKMALTVHCELTKCTFNFMLWNKYSQTSLIWTPKGQNQVSASQRCLHYRGSVCMIFGISRSKRTVRDREVSYYRGVCKERLDCVLYIYTSIQLHIDSPYSSFPIITKSACISFIYMSMKVCLCLGFNEDMILTSLDYISLACTLYFQSVSNYFQWQLFCSLLCYSGTLQT